MKVLLKAMTMSVITASVLLTACGKGDVEKVEQDEHVFQGQVKSLEKAQQVEGALMDAAKQQSQQIDQQAK